MSELTKEEFDARQNQFKVQLRSILTDGGVVVSGTVLKKTTSPPKDGRDSIYRVQLAIFGKTLPVKVLKSCWDAIGVGSFQVFRVDQTTYEGSIYNTALE
jgi:hypothetical protein